jgi:Predicted nucleic acid-binding protein, consists of a PIN domain and a Zn-ribbon module
MKIVVDASAIFAGFTPEGSNEYITTIDSISEIKSKKFRDTIERTLIFIEIKEPSQEFLDKVIAKSKETGDFYQLSENDLKLLALSMQEGAVLLTNDLSMQNIAHALEYQIY